MVLLSPLTLVSGKLQQLRLPGRGCSRDDRALWRVWMPVCVRASPRAPELPRGNCVPPGRKRKPASPAGGACSRTRSTLPAAGRQPPPPSRSALLPLRAPAPPRPPATRALPGSPPLRAPAPEPPATGHKHSLEPQQASAATRPIAKQSVARSRSQLSQSRKRQRRQVPHPPHPPGAEGTPLSPTCLIFFRYTSPEESAVAF